MFKTDDKRFQNIYPYDIDVKFYNLKKLDKSDFESRVYDVYHEIGSRRSLINDKKCKDNAVMYSFDSLTMIFPFFMELYIEILNKDECTFVTYGTEKEAERYFIDESQTRITLFNIKNNYNPEATTDPKGYYDYSECKFRNIYFLKDTDIIEDPENSFFLLENFIDYLLKERIFEIENVKEICIQSDDNKEYGESVMEFYRVFYKNEEGKYVINNPVFPNKAPVSNIPITPYTTLKVRVSAKFL